MNMNPRYLKRSRSHLSKKDISPKHSNKKHMKDSLSKSDFLKESSLGRALAESILSKPQGLSKFCIGTADQFTLQ